jgi:regulator of cell morphogenesis and NO signaling
MTHSGSINITANLSPAEIVKRYYRTAKVFKKHNIEYCCGGKWPLQMICESQGLDINALTGELEEAARIIILPESLPYHTWKINFLTEYIINIHHHYLRQSLPVIGSQLHQFLEEHKKKFPQLGTLETEFKLLEKKLIPHLNQEEEIIFPYILQIAHAHESKESYASLLVRTLRKPIDVIMDQEHEIVEKILIHFRELTNDYSPPEASCTTHQLTYSMLRDLDEDLVNHIHLENDILFPKAMAMEMELLNS